MQQVLLVGVGGFIGSALRYLASTGTQRLIGDPWLPYGTLAVNLTGCFLIGLLGGLAETRQMFSAEARLVLFIGVLGGFTTYSTFAHETLLLARESEYPAAAANLGLHFVLGMAAVWAGSALTRLG